LADHQLHQALHPETNSIAVIMQHLAGNMRSRWTDFLTTDDEKPDRNRDGEFVDDHAARAELLANWDSGWTRLLDTLNDLTNADLQKIVTRRGKSYTVIAAIDQQLFQNPMLVILRAKILLSWVAYSAIAPHPNFANSP